MTLETRAARAVRSLHGSVSSVSPTPVAVVARRHRLSLAGGLAGVATLAVASVALASVLTGSGNESVVAVTVPDTTVPAPVTTQAPAPAPVASVDSKDAEVVYQLLTTSAHAFTKFFGTAPAGTLVAATSDYGSSSMIVDDSGAFTLAVSFSDAPPGVEFPVTVTVGSETKVFPFTWTPVPVSVAAHQTFGSSSQSSPYEIFYGTAPAGTVVTASSPYGSGQATAGSKGDWTLKVFFTGAPVGQAFTVGVDVGGHAFTFPFTWTQSATTTTTKPPAPVPTSVTVLESHKDEYQGQWMKLLVGGPAGTKIQLTSAYGTSDLVTIDSSGKGVVKVFFSGIALDQTISVALKSNGATHSTHSFTNRWDPANTPITVHFWSESKPDHAKVKAYGTAPPGTSVSVTTNGYGAASGSAGSDGKYTIHLTLSPVPDPGTVIEVTVTVGGTVEHFSFTHDPS